jgi:hypothetical protein
MVAMNYVGSRAVDKFRKGIVVATMAGGLLGGAFAVSMSSAAGAAAAPGTTPSAVAPAFSGPQPIPEYLQTLVSIAIAFAEVAPDLAVNDTSIEVDKVLAETEAKLPSL